jgi:hypothetical protein
MRKQAPHPKIRRSVRRAEPSQKINKGNERKALGNSQKKQFHKLISGDIQEYLTK